MKDDIDQNPEWEEYTEKFHIFGEDDKISAALEAELNDFVEEMMAGGCPFAALF